MLRRLVVAGVALAGAAVLLLASWPQLVGLHRATPWAELTAMRGLIAALALAGAALLLLAAALSRRLRSVAILLALVYVGIVVLNGLVLSLRGFGGAEWAEEEPGDLTVLAWNTRGGRAGPELVARLALAESTDVLALAETGREDAELVAGILAQEGRHMQLFISDRGGLEQSTALLVSEELGEYVLDVEAGSTPVLPSLVARPVSGDGPTLVAAHPFPPIPSGMADWRAGLEWLAGICREGDVVLAGDLNATLDHFEGLRDPGFELGACRDAARATGSGAAGTWPAQLPGLLGAPIDHVMATEEWDAVSFRVDEPGGSDHRPVLARLRPTY